MIHDRREAWRLLVGDRWIGGGQHHLADRFERDAVVPLVEPDQRLPVRRRAIGPGVDVDDLVGRIFRGRLERHLDAAAGLDAVGTRRRVERHGISCIVALGETAHRRHGGSGRHPEERTSAHDPRSLSRGRGGARLEACGRDTAAIRMSRRLAEVRNRRWSSPGRGRTLEISLRCPLPMYPPVSPSIPHSRSY